MSRPFSIADADTYALRLKVLREVDTERNLQDAAWGEQNHANGTGGDEVDDIDGDLKPWAVQADLAKRMCEYHRGNGRMTYLDVLREEVYEAFAESDEVKLRDELLQVAAVAVLWVEKLDRTRITKRVQDILDAGQRQGPIDPRPVTDDGFDRRPYPEDH